MLLVNTFDVEPWWATVPPCIPEDRWNSMPDRSEAPLREYLDLCDDAGVQCTFFFLGWYAARFPELVREVVERGHEAGCHSYFHEDAATLGVDAFRANTARAKDLIEQAAGSSVVAYRAPSFSFPPDRCRELLGVLAELGFRLDSSISTAGRLYGGGFTREQFPGPRSLLTDYGVDLMEVPVPGVRIWSRELQIFGGGYLRIAPQFMLDRLMRSQDYQVLYVHPHDFDPDLPALPGAGWMSNLRRRATVGSLREKIRKLFASSRVRSCAQLLQDARPVH